MKKTALLKDRIFSQEPVNQGRQIELDIAKAIVIFCMAIVHTVIECTPESGLVSGIPYLFDSVIGGPLTAPLLMFSMGVGMVYSREKSTKHFVLRGLKLIIINYLLNIFRYIIPFAIGYEMTGDGERFGQPFWYLFLGNDILLFAGLAMIIMALVIHFRVNDAIMLAFSLALSVFATFFAGTDIGSPLGNYLLRYLVGTAEDPNMVCPYFPLAHWMVFVVCGFVFGKRLIRMKDKKLFYRIVSPICLVITVVYFATGICFERGMFGEGQACYYYMNMFDMLGALCAVFAVLGVYNLLARYLPQKLTRLVISISRNINAIYWIHWVILSVIVNILIYPLRGTAELPVGATVLLGTGISIVSLLIAHLINRRKRKS